MDDMDLDFMNNSNYVSSIIYGEELKSLTLVVIKKKNNVVSEVSHMIKPPYPTIPPTTAFRVPD